MNLLTCSVERALLFSLKTEWIKVIIEAYFDDTENLVVEGYDIGKRVEEVFGDSDYEYSFTVSLEELKKVYRLFNIPQDDKAGLLQYLQTHFNSNTCYSELRTLFDKNNIAQTGFSWT